MVVCSNQKCRKLFDKHEGNFNKNSSMKTGYSRYCKTCTVEANRKSYAKKRAETYKPLDKQVEFKLTLKDKLRLAKYMVKFYWAEEQSYFLTDIKKEEL